MPKEKTIKNEKSNESRRCQQVKCGFYLQGGCKQCDTCHAETYIINTNCSQCLRCENVPGACRFGDGQVVNSDNSAIADDEFDEVKEKLLTALKEAAGSELQKLQKKKVKKVVTCKC